MATTPEIPKLISSFFSKIDEQKTLITTYTNLYQTLISNFTQINSTLDSKSQTLDSTLQTLDSTFNQTLDSLKLREDSIPNLDTLSETIESRKNTALIQSARPIPEESASLTDKLKWVCGRMDPELLVKFLLVKRREAATLRFKMIEAFSECVDSERFVVEAVRGFVEMKREKRVGMTDYRWACSMAVGSMFQPENLKDGKVGSEGLSRVFAKKAVERAREVLSEWKLVADSEAEECGGCGMWHSEAAMFIEVTLGFDLKEMFDDEFYRKVVVEFCGRRVIAKLAVPIFGDRVGDVIEELLKGGKLIEGIYFAFEAGLTDRFHPVPLLKSALRKARRNFSEIIKNGDNSAAAVDEANSMEVIFLKSMIKCVEDHKMEEQYPVEALRKRLAILEKVKADKKGATVRYSKRTGGARPNVPQSSRPGKMQKRSSTNSAFARRDYAPPARSNPYPGTYTYPSQPTYDPGLTAPTYALSYGASHTPAAAAPAAALSSAYGSDVGYASYDYSASAAPAYQPPSYPQ